jgi:hypothetical protein
MDDEPNGPAKNIFARIREHNRTIEGLTRIEPEGLPLDRLMQHFAAQVSRVTNIERTKVLRYRPEGVANRTLELKICDCVFRVDGLQGQLAPQLALERNPV